MFLIFSLILISVIIVITFEPWKSKKLIKLGKLLKCDYIYYPIIGHGYIFGSTGYERMQMISELSHNSYNKEHGSVALWIGPYLFVSVSHPDVASALLNNKYCLEKPTIASRFASEIIGNASLFASVHDWRPRRKTITPLFSQKNLINFVKVFQCKSMLLVNNLAKVCGTGDVCIWDYVSAYTMETVCDTTLGVSVNALKQSKHPFCNSMNECLKAAAYRGFQPWLYIDQIYHLLPRYKTQKRNLNMVHSFVNDVVKKKRSEMNNERSKNKKIVDDTGNYKTLVELMLEAEDFSDVHVREEALLMIIAGTDTSSSNASFVLMLLALYPDVQERVYKEMNDVFKDDVVTYEKLGELKYTEAVIKETLRMYPPLPIVARRCERDITISSDVTLYKDTNVAINIWGILRHPDFWSPNPDQFNPDRFLHGEINKNNFPAFALGMRNCIGGRFAMLSAKTMLANIIRRFVFEPAANKSKIDVEDLKYDITLKHADFLLQVKERK